MQELVAKIPRLFPLLEKHPFNFDIYLKISHIPTWELPVDINTYAIISGIVDPNAPNANPEGTYSFVNHSAEQLIGFQKDVGWRVQAADVSIQKGDCARALDLYKQGLETVKAGDPLFFSAEEGGQAYAGLCKLKDRKLAETMFDFCPSFKYPDLCAKLFLYAAKHHKDVSQTEEMVQCLSKARDYLAKTVLQFGKWVGIKFSANESLEQRLRKITKRALKFRGNSWCYVFDSLKEINGLAISIGNTQLAEATREIFLNEIRNPGIPGYMWYPYYLQMRGNCYDTSEFLKSVAKESWREGYGYDAYAASILAGDKDEARKFGEAFSTSPREEIRHLKFPYWEIIPIVMQSPSLKERLIADMKRVISHKGELKDSWDVREFIEIYFLMGDLENVDRLLCFRDKDGLSYRIRSEKTFKQQKMITDYNMAVSFNRYLMGDALEAYNLLQRTQRGYYARTKL
jgi:hypothetical protein